MSLKNPLPVSNLDRKLPFQGISVTSFVCNLSAKKRKTKPRVYFDGSAPDDSRTLKPARLTHCHTILAEDVNKPPLPMAACCTHNSRGEFSQMQTIIWDRTSWKYEGSFLLVLFYHCWMGRNWTPWSEFLFFFYQPQRKAEKLFRPRSVCLVSLSHHFHGVSLRNFILSYLVIIKS